MGSVLVVRIQADKGQQMTKLKQSVWGIWHTMQAWYLNTGKLDVNVKGSNMHCEGHYCFGRVRRANLTPEQKQAKVDLGASIFMEK
jgi:hypothetical protein